MKLKLTSLIVASAVCLGACNSGGSRGSSNLDTTTATKPILSSTKSITSATNTTVLNFLGDNVWNAFSGSFFGFPGTWAATALLDLILGEQDQTDTQVVEQLTEINEKLTVALNGLKASLTISTEIQETLDTFFNSWSQSNVISALSSFDVSTINNKYSEYIKAKALSNESGVVTTLSSVYAYAAQHCNSTEIIDALDVTATTSTDSENDVDSLYTAFSNKFSSKTNTVYSTMEAAKSSYTKAIFNSLSESNMITPVKYYNYAVLSKQMEMVAAFQKLYSMQVTQLAYHYACGLNIEFSNLTRATISSSGEAGFISAVSNMNSQYTTDYTSITNNTTTYLKPIDNTEMYTLINQLFADSSNHTLLSSSSFNSNKREAGICSPNSLKFKNYAAPTSGTQSGIVYFSANCINMVKNIGESVIYESSTINLEIPYHATGSTSADRYGLYNIGFSSESKDVSYTIDSEALEDEDIENIAKIREFAPGWGVDNRESMNIIAPTKTYKKYKEWGKFQIDAVDAVNFYTNQKYVSSLSGYTYTDMMIPGYTTVQHTKDSISREFYGYKFPEGYAEKDFYYDQWFMGDYHGKAFAIKVQHVHYNETGYNDDTDEHMNMPLTQTAGIFCLGECTRQDDGSTWDDNTTTLTWTDGTQLKMDLSGSISEAPKSWDENFSEDNTTYITGSITKS